MGSGERVQVVVGDDHPMFRDGVVRALQSSGSIDVIAEADDGVEALAAIRDTGRAGGLGTYKDQSVLARKFVIDFAGDTLDRLTEDAEPEPVVTATHGRIGNPYVQHVEDTGRWRVIFDWKGELPPDDTPVELRARLGHNDRVLTETWMYAYYPQALPRRLSDNDDATGAS